MESETIPAPLLNPSVTSPHHQAAPEWQTSDSIIQTGQHLTKEGDPHQFFPG